MMDITNNILDICYNFKTDLSFDQNDQQLVLDVLFIEKNLLTKQKALQFMCLQHDNIEEYISDQDPWKILEETKTVQEFEQVANFNF